MTGAPARTLEGVSSSQGGFSTGLANAISYAILVLGVLYVACMGYLVFRGYSSFPFGDQWTYLDALGKNHGAVTWNLLWSQHMEHRIVFPKFFYLADLYLFGGKNVSLVASIFGLQLLHAAVWIAAVRGFGGFSGAALRTAGGWICFCLFRPSQIENFIWGFQVCFILPIAAATMAFACLLHAAPEDKLSKPRLDWMTLAMFASIAAAFSLANGLLAPVLLVPLAWCAEFSRKWIAAMTVLAAAIWGAYFFHFQSFGHFVTANSVWNIPKALLFYFGVSWERISLVAASAAVAIVIITVITMYLTAIFRSWNPRRLELLLLSMSMFCIGSGLMAVMGRSQFGLEYLYKSRYQSIALLFWLAVGILGLHWVLGRAIQTWSLGGVSMQAILLIVMVVSAIGVPGSTTLLVGRKRLLATAGLALVTRAADASIAGNVPDFMLFGGREPALLYLRGLHTWLFTDRFYRAFGEDLRQEYSFAADSACKGSIASVSPIAGEIERGSRITGWAWLNGPQTPAEKILLVNPTGTVVGLARNDRYGENFDFARHPSAPAASGWYGFIAPLREPTTIRAYALAQDRHAACALPGEVTVAAMTKP
jgi:hypothetical protein